MDLLSSALLSFKVQMLMVADCRFAGDWGVVYDDFRTPYAVVVLEGACWTRLGSQPAQRLQAGDAQLVLREEQAAWSSTPDRPCERLSVHLAAQGHAAPTVDDTPRRPWAVRFGDAGHDREDTANGTAGRLIVFVFDHDRDGPGLLPRRLPATLALDAPLGEAVAALRAALERLLDRSHEGPGYAALVQTLATSLIVSLLREWVVSRCAAQPGGVEGWLDARFERALGAMQSRPAEPWHLASLAALAGMSRSAFARDFPLVFGCTPMRYLADLRLQQAMELLDHTAWSVERIAEYVGLGNAQRLRAGVLRRTGLTPGAWRQRSRPG